MAKEPVWAQQRHWKHEITGHKHRNPGQNPTIVYDNSSKGLLQLSSQYQAALASVRQLPGWPPKHEVESDDGGLDPSTHDQPVLGPDRRQSCALLAAPEAGNAHMDHDSG